MKFIAPTIGAETFRPAAQHPAPSPDCRMLASLVAAYCYARRMIAQGATADRRVSARQKAARLAILIDRLNGPPRALLDEEPRG